MGIPIYLEDFEPAVKKINDRLDRIEQALIELSKKPVPKPQPKKVK